jgi:hypothetical protein
MGMKWKIVNAVVYPTMFKKVNTVKVIYWRFSKILRVDMQRVI